MPKVPPIKRRLLIKKLHALGFLGPFSGGKHEFMRNESGLKVTIPNPHGKDISGILQTKIVTIQPS